MDDYFAAIPVTNATMLCVGGITTIEADQIRSDGIDVDGFGYYLFLANESALNEPIQVLAKFFSTAEAETAARLFSMRSAQVHNRLRQAAVQVR